MSLFIMLRDLVDHCRFSLTGLEEPDVLRDFIVHLLQEVDCGVSWLLTVSAR